MLWSELCDYSDTCIVVEGTINVTDPNNNAYDKKLAVKNNAPVFSCITKINKTLVDNAKDLDIAIPMYNLMEYSKNYSKTTGSLCNYYRDEPNSGVVGNMNYSIKDPKCFDYKTSITGVLECKNTEKKVQVAVPLKYLSKFWRTIDISLINCELNLILTGSENCVLTSKTTRDADPEADPAVAEINNPTGATFKITNTKLHALVVTLSTEDYNKLLEQLKIRFKKTIRWNKYRSEISQQTKNKNLNYLIDPTISRAKRLFILSFENDGDRTSFSKYYTPSVEIKDFNVLIDGKSFFDIPIKNKEEKYPGNIEMSKNNNYTTSKLLDYEYFSKH